MICEFAGDMAILSRKGKIVATSTRKDMTYVLTARASGSVRRSLSQSELWHQRLGHPGERKTQLIEKAATNGAVEGAPRGLQHVTDCEICQTTKSTQVVSRVPAEKTMEPLSRVHIDFWGPYCVETIGGRRYMLTITDDFIRKS